MNLIPLLSMAKRACSVGRGAGRRQARRLAGVAALATLTVLLTGCNTARPTIRVRLAGAQIPVELVEAWLEGAESVNFEVERVSYFQSAGGFSRLRQQHCDVACTDRLPDRQEAERLADVPLQAWRLGWYAFGFYVHSDNPVDTIFVRDVRNIFSGKFTNWKDLGGPDAPIRLYGPARSTRAGLNLAQITGVFFVEPTWTVLESPQRIVEAVGADPLALGYAELTDMHHGTARPLGIRMRRDGEAVWPTEDALTADRYPAQKMVYIYIRRDGPNPEVTRTVVEYLRSPAARESMRQTGVRPVQTELRPAQPIGNPPE